MKEENSNSGCAAWLALEIGGIILMGATDVRFVTVLFWIVVVFGLVSPFIVASNDRKRRPSISMQVLGLILIIIGIVTFFVNSELVSFPGDHKILFYALCIISIMGYLIGLFRNRTSIVARTEELCQRSDQN